MQYEAAYTEVTKTIKVKSYLEPQEYSSQCRFEYEEKEVTEDRLQFFDGCWYAVPIVERKYEIT